MYVCVSATTCLYCRLHEKKEQKEEERSSDQQGKRERENEGGRVEKDHRPAIFSSSYASHLCSQSTQSTPRGVREGMK